MIVYVLILFDKFTENPRDFHTAGLPTLILSAESTAGSLHPGIPHPTS